RRLTTGAPSLSQRRLLVSTHTPTDHVGDAFGSCSPAAEDRSITKKDDGVVSMTSPPVNTSASRKIPLQVTPCSVVPRRGQKRKEPLDKPTALACVPCPRICDVDRF